MIPEPDGGERRFVWRAWRIPLCLTAVWSVLALMPFGRPVPHRIAVLGWGASAALTALFLLWLIFYALIRISEARRDT